MATTIMFCPRCGSDADQGSQYCKKCGAPMNGSANQQYTAQYQSPAPLKNSGIAAVLAFLIAGLGHIYLGRITKGLLLLITEVILSVLSIIVFPLIGIIGFIIWIWQIYDAYREAEEYNRSVQATGQKPW